MSIGLEIFGLKKLDQSVDHSQVLGRAAVTMQGGWQIDAYDIGLYFEETRSAVNSAGAGGGPLREGLEPSAMTEFWY